MLPATGARVGSVFDVDVHCLQGDRGFVGSKSQHVSISQQAQLASPHLVTNMY